MPQGRRSALAFPHLQLRSSQRWPLIFRRLSPEVTQGQALPFPASCATSPSDSAQGFPLRSSDSSIVRLGRRHQQKVTASPCCPGTAPALVVSGALRPVLKAEGSHHDAASDGTYGPEPPHCFAERDLQPPVCHTATAGALLPHHHLPAQSSPLSPLQLPLLTGPCGTTSRRQFSLQPLCSVVLSPISPSLLSVTVLHWPHPS